MNETTLDTIVTLLATIIIPAVIAAIVPPIRQYLQAKIAAVQDEQLRTRIYNLVLAAEQQFAGVASDQRKLDYVTEHAYVFVHELGLKLTRGQLRPLIEAAVRAMIVDGAAVVEPVIAGGLPVPDYRRPVLGREIPYGAGEDGR